MYLNHYSNVAPANVQSMTLSFISWIKTPIFCAVYFNHDVLILLQMDRNSQTDPEQEGHRDWYIQKFLPLHNGIVCIMYDTLEHITFCKFKIIVLIVYTKHIFCCSIKLHIQRKAEERHNKLKFYKLPLEFLYKYLTSSFIVPCLLRKRGTLKLICLSVCPSVTKTLTWLISS